MKMQISNIALSLLLGLTAGAEESTSLNCDGDLKKLEAELKKVNAANPEAGEECRRQANLTIKNCSVTWSGGKCRNIPDPESLAGWSAPKTDTGGVEELDIMIDKLLQVSNCYKYVVPCLMGLDNPKTAAPGDKQDGVPTQSLRRCHDGKKKSIADTLADRDKGIGPTPDEKYTSEVRGFLGKEGSCLRDAADDYVSRAKAAAEISRLRHDDGLNENREVVCMDKLPTSGGGQYNVYYCQYQHDGVSHFEKDESLPPEADDKRAGHSVNIGEFCSGTLLKGGRKVHLAGHCTDEFEGDTKDINVKFVDANGFSHSVQARCAKGVYERTTRDFTLCELPGSFPANDVLMVVPDDSRGKDLARCWEDGFIKRCSSGRLSRVKHELNVLYGYTDFGEGTVPISTKGYVSIDVETGEVYNSAFTRRGNSGGGFQMELDGDRVVLAPLSGSNSRSDALNGPLSSYGFLATQEDLDATLSQLSPESIISAEPLMREISLLDGIH